MRILVTIPGKFGDVLWAMATVRAIAETYGERVDVLVSENYKDILPLLQQQPYVQYALIGHGWHVQDTAPMTPRVPPWLPAGYDRIFHLGYDGWPQHPLPLEHWRLAVQQKEWYAADPPLKDVELGRAWITYRMAPMTARVAVGFTDEHFELKYGLTVLLHQQRPPDYLTIVPPNSRWDREHVSGALTLANVGWEGAAAVIGNADVFLGCNSALHVLAVALGTPAVIMEPNEMRHHDIFWPLGRTGPQVTQVLGNDGRWTWDSRHVADVLESVRSSAAEKESPRV